MHGWAFYTSRYLGTRYDYSSGRRHVLCVVVGNDKLSIENSDADIQVQQSGLAILARTAEAMMIDFRNVTTGVCDCGLTVRMSAEFPKVSGHVLGTLHWNVGG